MTHCVQAHDITYALKGLLEEKRIVLIRESQNVSEKDILALRQDQPEKKIFVCDFYIANIEKYTEIPGGYFHENIYNIDHHAPTKRMAQEISATHLAIDYVKAYGIIPQDAIIIINHTDCDSVLSSCIMAGILPPEDRFARAAKAADHTGEENTIADVLQAISGERDLLFSITTLANILDNKPLEEKAKTLLQKRTDDRELIKTLIEQKAFIVDGAVTYASSPRKIDAGLLPALLPGSVIIMLASPMPDDPIKINYTIRRGPNAPLGFYLNTLNLDKEFGGRWNAISNKRGGGTTRPISDYVKIINEKLSAYGI